MQGIENMLLGGGIEKPKKDIQGRPKSEATFFYDL